MYVWIVTICMYISLSSDRKLSDLVYKYMYNVNISVCFQIHFSVYRYIFFHIYFFEYKLSAPMLKSILHMCHYKHFYVSVQLLIITFTEIVQV